MITPWPLLLVLCVAAGGAGALLSTLAQRLCIDAPHASRVRRSGPAAMLVMSTSVAAFTAPTIVAFVLLVATSAVLTVVSLVDLAERRIPNVVTYPTIAVCVGVAIGGSIVGMSGSVVSAVVGASIFTFLLFVPHLLRPDAMGLGDVKLAAPLGFAIGWAHGDAADIGVIIGWTVAGASILGLLFAASQTARSGRSMRGASVPFGPALSLAAWFAAAASVAGA